ncbi:MAG: hypothetical protein GX660_01165 [Clostridiaceae bacterium]|jgi:hypothetical protein|nr:hypothetical protein [Clostridiaceae bacterium]
MKMKDNMIDIFKVLSGDEVLLRLLYYKPKNALDDPLSADKSNVLLMENKWDIIDDVLKPIPKTDDLENQTKCRIMFYPGRRLKQPGNYLTASQYVVFDVLVHFDFEIDFRMEQICDRLNELVFNQNITGMGGGKYIDGNQIRVPEGYIGYRLTYSFGSVNG